MPKSVLFVCLGNICRSPMAEAVFLATIKERGLASEWTVDSAGILDYHLGKNPDKRTLKTLKDHEIDKDYVHKGRQVTARDFQEFDYIFGMDQQNIKCFSDLEDIKPPRNVKAKIALLGSFDPEKQLIIEDPYYSSGRDAFEAVYEQCVRCCKGFLDSL